MDGLNSRFDMAEEWIRELEGWLEEAIQKEEWREKDGKYREEVTDMGVTMRRSYIHLNAVPEEEKRNRNRGKIWKDNRSELSRMDGRYQSIDLRTQVNPKQNK